MFPPLPAAPMPPVPAEAPRALRVAELPPLPLECGETLRGACLAYHLDGALSPARDNAVLVLHPLTGSADAAGEWWSGLIGPGCALDTRTHAVLAPNLLGSCYGSTGPAQCPDGFPQLTTRDMARAIGVLLERLGVARLALVTGGSLGGMVALEFVATFPRRADAAVILAAPVAHSAAAIAWTHVQREALRLAGTAGLRLARQVAMLSYRTPHGLHHRFRRFPGARGAFAVQDWLDAHGERLDARFDGASYLALLDAMDTHDLARGRGGAGERLRGSGTRLTAVGIPGDQLYPAEEVKAWAGEAGARYVELRSLHGHDAFLIEREQVAGILRDALRSPGSDAREVA